MKFFDPLPLPNADAATLVRAFSLFRGVDPGNALHAFFMRQWELPIQSGYYEIANHCPAWSFHRVGSRTVVMIDGISTQHQARLLMDGYEGTLQAGFNSPDNPRYTEWARGILDRLISWNIFTGDDVTLVGWSAGGALAARVPTLRLTRKSSDATIRVVSYGAPRLGSESLNSRVRQEATLCRYMAHDDPIPNYPPRSGTFTWIPFAVGIRASLRFANFCHHAGGICIDENGAFIDRTTPVNGNITAGVALDVYWNSMQANSLSPHSISKYSRLLDLQATHYAPQTPGQVTVAEHTQQAPPSELHAQERHTFSAVRDLQQSQESQRVIIPRQRLARAVRQGRVWYVVWNDTPIMMTPTRRRAQGLARELNEFLRRMQSTAYVDPGSLTDQIQAFLQLASDASSDIKPTLSTSIPVG